MSGPSPKPLPPHLSRLPNCPHYPHLPKCFSPTHLWFVNLFVCRQSARTSPPRHRSQRKLTLAPPLVAIFYLAPSGSLSSASTSPVPPSTSLVAHAGAGRRDAGEAVGRGAMREGVDAAGVPHCARAVVRVGCGGWRGSESVVVPDCPLKQAPEMISPGGGWRVDSVPVHLAAAERVAVNLWRVGLGVEELGESACGRGYSVSLIIAGQIAELVVVRDGWGLGLVLRINWGMGLIARRRQ